MLYFDHNATAPLLPEAEAAFLAASREHFANPSSPHRAGARARVELESLRERLADGLRADPADLIFTSGATEGINAVWQHWARTTGAGKPVVLSTIEHPSVVEAAASLFANKVLSAEVTSQGQLNLPVLETLLERKEAGLVAVMAANNETGVLQPWAQVADLCRGHGIPHLCDAVQWIGRMPLDDQAKASIIIGSAHKFGGPKGVGFLRIPASLEGFHAQYGGEQEGGRRAGTENLPAVAGMVAALETTVSRNASERGMRHTWRDQFIARMQRLGARALGAGSDCLWNTVSLIMPHAANIRWINQLGRRGVMVSSGSACATGREGPSSVLSAMGVDAVEARRALRVSSGWNTSEDDWAALADAFEDADNSLRKGTVSTVIDI